MSFLKWYLDGFAQRACEVSALKVDGSIDKNQFFSLELLVFKKLKFIDTKKVYFIQNEKA